MDRLPVFKALGDNTRYAIYLELARASRPLSTADIADAIGLAQPEGALVAGVNGGTPAAKAGIKAGDIIIALGGNPVKSPRDLSRMVADLSPGTSKNLSLWRTGKTKDVAITIGDNAADQQ